MLSEVHTLLEQGHREIVLCGVHLGAFGRPSARRAPGDDASPLADLIAQLAELPALERLRLSSLECGDLTDPLLDVLAAHPAVCPHLHLPLQSGSDPVLARMNRRYTAAEYLAVVARARAAMDHPAFTTDVMVGFPGEREEDFEATLAVVREVGFAKVHVFPFSPRPGTAAWAWRSEASPAAQIKRRCAKLAALARQLGQAYRRQFVGQTVRVLLENDPTCPPPAAGGLTERYVRVRVAPSPTAPLPSQHMGRIVPVQVTACDGAGLTGVLET